MFEEWRIKHNINYNNILSAAKMQESETLGTVEKYVKFSAKKVLTNGMGRGIINKRSREPVKNGER